MMTFIRYFPLVVPVPIFLEFYLLEQCCSINNNSYTGENHSVHPTFIDLTNVRLHKDMDGNLANWSVFSPWSTVIIIPVMNTPQIITNMAVEKGMAKVDKGVIIVQAILTAVVGKSTSLRME